MGAGGGGDAEEEADVEVRARGGGRGSDASDMDAVGWEVEGRGGGRDAVSSRESTEAAVPEHRQSEINEVDAAVPSVSFVLDS